MVEPAGYAPVRQDPDTVSFALIVLLPHPARLGQLVASVPLSASCPNPARPRPVIWPSGIASQNWLKNDQAA
jgi:hypothetical protein